jgi:pimeloyl-ACP methyl ester carboxylesterase
MTMNSTIMPDLGTTSISLDFNELTNGPLAASASDTTAMKSYVERLNAFLEQEETWRARPRLVVGHSFGGMLALSWILSCQRMEASPVDGLILIATSAGPLFDRVRLRLGSMRKREWRLPLSVPLAIWNRPAVTRLVKLLTSGFGQRIGQVDFGSLRRQTDFAVDMAGWRNTDWRAMRSFRFALSGFDIRDRLGEITLPTIILHGTRDSLFSIDVAEDLAAGLPNAELRIVEGAGHALPLTHGEEVVRALRVLSPT